METNEFTTSGILLSFDSGHKISTTGEVIFGS